MLTDIIIDLTRHRIMDDPSPFSCSYSSLAPDTVDWPAEMFLQPSNVELLNSFEPTENWFDTNTQTSQWSTSECADSSNSSDSPRVWSPPQSHPVQLARTHQFRSLDRTLIEPPTITVGIVSAAERKAAAKRRRQQQNRDAQRTFRQRRQEELEKLGIELEVEKQKRVSCEAEVERLHGELEKMRQLLQATTAICELTQEKSFAMKIEHEEGP